MSTLPEVCARIDRVNKQLQEVKKKNTERVNKIAGNKRDLLNEISKIRQDFNTHLDQLEEKAVNALNATEGELQKELKANLDILESHIDNLTRLKTSLNENERSRSDDVDEVIKDAKSFVQNVNKISCLTLKMAPNEELVSSIKNSSRLATFDFHLPEKPVIPRVKLEAKKFDEIAVDDRKRDHPRYISCICQMYDRTFVLADTNNNELIRVDNDFNTTQTLALEDGPYGLCALDVDEVAVRLCNKTIQIVQAEPSLSVKKTIYIDETPYSCGLVFSRGMFWSSGFRGVNLYLKDGSRHRSIVNEINGVKPFLKGQPEDIAVSKDGSEVFVTDSKDGVLVFGQDGKYKMALRDERLLQSKGVAVTEDGLVMVAGFNSKNIIAFNPDTNTSNIFATRKGLTGYPVSLHYDCRQNRLLVGCNNSKILVFEMNK